MIWFDQRQSSINSDIKLVLCSTVCKKKRKMINGGGDGDDYDVYNKILTIYNFFLLASVTVLDCLQSWKLFINLHKHPVK